MRTRGEILRLARELARAVGESEEISELQRCEAALQGVPTDLSERADDPRVAAYCAAKERAERLMNHVTSAFLFPLTGGVQPLPENQAGCAGCER